MQNARSRPAPPPASTTAAEPDEWLEVATLAERRRLVRAMLVCVDLALPHADRYIASLEQARAACAAWLEGNAPKARAQHLPRIEEQLRWAETTALHAHKAKFDAIFGWGHGNSFAAAERADRLQAVALAVEAVLLMVRALDGSIDEAERAVRICARRAVAAAGCSAARNGKRQTQVKLDAGCMLWERIEAEVAARCLDPV